MKNLKLYNPGDVINISAEPGKELTAAEIQQRYETGKVAGCWYDGEEHDRFRELAKASGGYSDYEGAAHANGIAGSFAGKLVLPWLNAMALMMNCFPGAAQARGDCFPPGTKVRMADGSERPIEQVAVGESVLTHEGRPGVVTRVIEKPYNGNLSVLSVDGYANPLKATPDHRLIKYPKLWRERDSANRGNRWKERSEEREWGAIGTLAKGDYVSLPRVVAEQEERVFDLAELPGVFADAGESGRCVRPQEGTVRSKFCTHEVKRFVKLDERLAWLLGIYLAEGGLDADESGDGYRRITFSLNKTEGIIAEQIKEYSKDLFGVEATAPPMPSKPSVTLVRIAAKPVAMFFASLISGNVYSKQIPWQVFSASRSVRLAMLRGWMDGDGSLALGPRRGKQAGLSRCKLTGVSASHSLARGMFDLANSCGMRPTLTKRNPRKQSRAASDVHLHGEQALAVYPEMRSECKTVAMRTRHHAITAHGLAVKVKSVVSEKYTGNVYCLDVAGDHSFIAEGYAAHNCVSHGCRTSIFLAMVGDIISGIADSATGMLEGVPAELSPAGILDLPLSSESLWWWRGYSGDGWSIDSAMNVALQHGILLRKNYPELGFDLTNYSYANTALYGGRSPSAAIDAEQQKHKPVTAADASSFEEIQDALGNLHGVTSDGGEAWSSSRDQYGYSPQSGRWSHDFPQIGTDSRKEIVAIFGEPLVLNINNWAKWNGGPRDIYLSAHLVPPQFKDRWIKLGLVNPATGNILIPDGAWWAKWSSMKNRQFKVAAGFRGWAKKPLANLGATGLI